MNDELLTEIFSSRTWQIKETTEDSCFSVGAFFSWDDIKYMKKNCPDLEGTVFVNINTGKEIAIKHRYLNCDNIISKAYEEFLNNGMAHIVIDLHKDRQSIKKLIKRVSELPQKEKYKSYKMAMRYFGYEK